MLFEFELRPIEAIPPWGTPSNLSLSWFGLTDGFYRLKMGDQYLLNYTNEIIGHWKHQYPELNFLPKPTWVDYQVVRLWEDILDMLPYILEPLPNELIAILEKNDSDTEKWKDKLASCLKNEDAFWNATAWIDQRHLDSAYLSHGAYIRMWMANDEVCIKWDNKACVVEGIPVWSAQQGICRMPAAIFLQEVHSFHERLMNAMEERIATILENKGINSVYIDLKHLSEEQEDRKQWLGNALAKPRSGQELEAALKILSVNNFGID